MALAGLFPLLQTAIGQTTDPGTDLRAEITISKARYCDGSSDAAVLQLDCDLRFTNVGREPLIVEKEGDVVGISLAEKVEDLARPKYQWFPTLYFAGGASIDTPRPGVAFAVLKIGRSFQLRRTVPILFSTGEPVPGFVVPGSYWLRLRIGTWSDSDELAAKLSERWKRWGRLWTDDVKSTPILVTIQRGAKLQTCN